ncbi:unnamed protein product [Closterium sp. NIES-65]|nr:unnamed protein product [Closterium sp. NIES-65]
MMRAGESWDWSLSCRQLHPRHPLTSCFTLQPAPRSSRRTSRVLRVLQGDANKWSTGSVPAGLKKAAAAILVSLSLIHAAAFRAPHYALKQADGSWATGKDGQGSVAAAGVALEALAALKELGLVDEKQVRFDGSEGLVVVWKGMGKVKVRGSAAAGVVLKARAALKELGLVDEKQVRVGEKQMFGLGGDSAWCRRLQMLSARSSLSSQLTRLCYHVDLSLTTLATASALTGYLAFDSTLSSPLFLHPASLPHPLRPVPAPLSSLPSPFPPFKPPSRSSHFPGFPTRPADPSGNAASFFSASSAEGGTLVATASAAITGYSALASPLSSPLSVTLPLFRPPPHPLRPRHPRRAGLSSPRRPPSRATSRSPLPSPPPSSFTLPLFHPSHPLCAPCPPSPSLPCPSRPPPARPHGPLPLADPSGNAVSFFSASPSEGGTLVATASAITGYLALASTLGSPLAVRPPKLAEAGRYLVAALPLSLAEAAAWAEALAVLDNNP